MRRSKLVIKKEVCILTCIKRIANALMFLKEVIVVVFLEKEIYFCMRALGSFLFIWKVYMGFVWKRINLSKSFSLEKVMCERS